PVVLSAKRLQDIVYRSTMGAKRDRLAAVAEEQKYLEYLKAGHEALYGRFSNIGATTLDEEKQAKLDQELAEAEIRERQVRLEDERTRKERIMRANRILENLKPGQRALHHALIESETIHQRKFNEAVNREIIEDAERQERLDELQCPVTLILTNQVTEEELKAQETAKAIEIRTAFLKDIEERRERKIAEREQEVFEGIVEREQYKCLQEKERQAARQLVEKKRQLCRDAYRESMKDKAATAHFEKVCDSIDDRVVCVDNARRRNLDRRYNKDLQAMRAKQIRNRELAAIKVCRQIQAQKRTVRHIDEQNETRYEAEIEMDEARRQCQFEQLAKERRAYQKIEQAQAHKKRLRDAQIRRYQVAERLKNEETNRRFAITQKRLKDRATANLRSILHGQRDEFAEQRRQEKMHISQCQANPNLQEDLNFVTDALKAAQLARNDGRPVYPIAKAVEVYRRKNQLEVEPEGKNVKRNKLRDYCWPGYHSKADLAYRQYEHRDACREEQEFDRHQIFRNCIKITKLAAEEQPYKSCIASCPTKCFQHRGMPQIDSVDSIEVCRDVCYNDAPPVPVCRSSMQVI
ncbi:hypothetical protein KR093_007885, partial [Drosophila rubida]